MNARVVKNDRNTPRGFTINTSDLLYFVLDTAIVLQDFSTCISFHRACRFVCVEYEDMALMLTKLGSATPQKVVELADTLGLGKLSNMHSYVAAISDKVHRARPQMTKFGR